MRLTTKGRYAVTAMLDLALHRGSRLAHALLTNFASATPDFVVWVVAPPKASAVTDSCVTVFTTSGPVTNM